MKFHENPFSNSTVLTRTHTWTYRLIGRGVPRGSEHTWNYHLQIPWWWMYTHWYWSHDLCFPGHKPPLLNPSSLASHSYNYAYIRFRYFHCTKPTNRKVGSCMNRLPQIHIHTTEIIQSVRRNLLANLASLYARLEIRRAQRIIFRCLPQPL